MNNNPLVHEISGVLGRVKGYKERSEEILL